MRLCYWVWPEERKTGKILVPSSALYIVLKLNNSILFTYIVDPDRLRTVYHDWIYFFNAWMKLD